MRLTTETADSYPDVAVVMITRNEERAVKGVIDGAMQALPGAEVFVIDGSDDRTPEIARQAGATVIREPGGGFGPALHAALLAPDRPIVVTVDADDTYPASVFPTLVRLIREGWEVAGTDRLGRWPSAMPASNWLANHVFSGLGSLRARRRLRDVHSGQRAYRAEVLRSFEWDYLGLAFPVDLLLWPALAGFKVVEVPIAYTERIGETKLRRWPSGKATLRRLLRSRSMVKRRAPREEAGSRPLAGAADQLPRESRGR
jgi:glycosyltransferase involved in cell wall biosynthesis